MFYKHTAENDCINNNHSGLCTGDIQDIFEPLVANSSLEIVKKISFSIPYLAETKYNIFRFNGDLGVLENLKPKYKEMIFDKLYGKTVLKKGALQIDSNDTVRVIVGNNYFTFIKRSDFYALKNPYGETLAPSGQQRKVYRDTKNNFITDSLLNILKDNEPDTEYLIDFQDQILKKYILQENQQNQILTQVSYGSFTEFYAVLKKASSNLNHVHQVLTSSENKPYQNFLASQITEIKNFYNQSAYKLKGHTYQNITMPLFVDLLQEISPPGSLGEKIVGRLQKIHTLADIPDPESIITKIKDFALAKNLNQEQVAKILILALSAHDPHTALEHSITMSNLLKLFFEFIKNDNYKYELEIFGRQLTEPEKQALVLGFLLHDIGKTFISNILLRKKGNVNNLFFAGKKEKEHLDQHSEFGLKIIEELEKNIPHLKFNEIVKLCIHKHHRPTEVLDPFLKTGVELALLFDIFNAALSDRSYSQGESIHDFFNDPRNRKLPFIYYLKLFVKK